jgi:hypothetical protein
MDIGCRDQRDRDDSGKCGTDTHHCSPMHANPQRQRQMTAPSRQPSAIFQKMQVVCPKKVGQTHTLALLCFSSKRATGSRMLQERGNPGA